MSARKISLTLHLWVGLLAAIFLFIEGVTGGIMAWGPEILRVLNPPNPQTGPPVYHVPTGPGTLPLTELTAVLEKKHPGFQVRTMQFPMQADQAWSAGLQSPAMASLTVWFDPRTGETMGEQAQSIRFGWLKQFVQVASRFHGNIVGGVALFLIACSGLILWWPRKITMPGRPVSVARTNFDLHNTIGFYSSLFLLLFSATAMVMSSSRTAINLLSRITHTPLPTPPRRANPAATKADPNRRAPLAVRLDFDQALKAAEQAHPGVRFTEMRRLDDGVGSVVFSYQLPDANPPQSSSILVNPVTGGIQEPQNRGDFTLPEKIVRVWVRQTHTGDILGRPSRWIAGFFSFMLALLAVTGPAIWWMRRRGDRTTLQESSN